jgi:hypothetical protein
MSALTGAAIFALLMAPVSISAFVLSPIAHEAPDCCGERIASDVTVQLVVGLPRVENIDYSPADFLMLTQ